ncbi:pentapeptide repeat-containing protein [Streptomyces sp. NPDC001663]|uniref:pentapeptide repeat-containing protein n=1 Tax=Streptomyces sp. NPDC001663 TaxID=3364597 RepID=UPI0036B0588D
MLDALLDALRDPATGHPHLGNTRFDSASFQGAASFKSASFQGSVSFASAIFHSTAMFISASFHSGAGFTSASFHGDARFDLSSFHDDASFGSAIFHELVMFEHASFRGNAGFDSAAFRHMAFFGWVSFHGAAWFDSAKFEHYARFVATTFKIGAMFKATVFYHNADFEQAVFERALSLGPLMCAGRVVLSGAVFGGPVTVSLATRRLECRRTRWSSTAEVRLRYTTVDFSHAVFEYPLTIAAEAAPFTLPSGQPVAEQALVGAPDATVRIASLRGVDAAHLILADVDLSGCLFAGTVHLDQLRLEGTCSFARVPPGIHWRRGRLVRFTQRRTLAEEHHWRASQPAAVRGWNVAVFGAGSVGPLHLAPVYRALRKAFEDGKHEPGAADFYYGEMEMRRHADDIPGSERRLLNAYWALSGYSMRASRALAWLGAAMFVTIVLLMSFGLPQDSPRQEATGTVPPGGGKVTFQIDKTDPHNPTGNRFTDVRFEKALNVTLNSVVFRSADQDLTTSGAYIEMTSRVTEPVLLGLAVLAIRNRVKR